MNLFEYQAAQVAKEIGMQAANANAAERWCDLMLLLVQFTCQEQLVFTSDDIFDRYDAIDSPPTTHDNRAFGSIMRVAARKGWCEKTDTVRESKRKSLHASPRAVWRSQIYARGR